MESIIRWLLKVERIAGEVYTEAAEYFKNDVDFKRFLERNADDEAWHYHVMGNALSLISTDPDLVPAITVDRETTEKILLYFEEIQAGLKNKSLTKDALILKIVEAELSEWNYIFIYVVNVLLEDAQEFKYPASKIQAHIKEIEHYLEKQKNGCALLNKLTEISNIWAENILVVDDNPSITKLIQTLLRRDGNIDIARNGAEGLSSIEKKFYKLIISDIDMPIKNGISFYKEAVERSPKLANRFLFLTGDLTSQRVSFFKDRGIKYMAKPMEISTFRREAEKIILGEGS